jgi:hypothetical protein
MRLVVRRVGWFIALWALGVGALAAVAAAIQLLL